jgi:hypothetical protein
LGLTLAGYLLGTGYVARSYYYHVIVEGKTSDEQILVFINCKRVWRPPTSFERRTYDLGWLSGGDVITATATATTENSGGYWLQAIIDGRRHAFGSYGLPDANAAAPVGKVLRRSSLTAGGRRLADLGCNEDTRDSIERKHPSIVADSPPGDTRPRRNRLYDLATGSRQPILIMLSAIGALFMLVMFWVAARERARGDASWWKQLCVVFAAGCGFVVDVLSVLPAVGGAWMAALGGATGALALLVACGWLFNKAFSVATVTVREIPPRRTTNHNQSRKGGRR